MSGKPVIAVVGGTGAEGGGLALRLAHAGYPVIIGSREPARAAEAARAMNAQLGAENVSGTDGATAAAAADIVLMTVPYSGQQATASALAPHLGGKLLIDATVPLVPPKVSRVQLPDGGSAVAKVQDMLGPDVKVVAAFQNVSAHHLKDLEHEVECDVLVCGDDMEACETVMGLAEAIGLRGIYAGPICNAAAVEALTSVLITINRRHKAAGSGIRVTGI
jgi:NADPH-dependent F420 reductase